MSDMKKKRNYKYWNEMGLGIRILIIIGGIIAIPGFIVLFGFIFMWLWNWIMPGVFGLRSISYWEGWGILILAYILFHSKHGSNLMSNVNERRRKHKLHKRMEDLEANAPEHGNAEKA